MNKNPTIWALAFPIILSNITIPLLGAVDAAVMGHMESAAYLGAVAIGGLIFDYIYWGFGFLRQATTGLAGQALGAEDGEEARAVLARALMIAIGGAVILWIGQSFIFWAAINVIEASAEVEGLAETYFDIRIWSAPAALMNYAIMGWVLAHKDTKSILIQQVTINIINLVLDLWFVMGLGYGVEGVALASVIAQYVGLLIGFVIVKRKLSGLFGEWDIEQVFQRYEFKCLFSMNADIFVRTVCLLSAFAWFTAQGAKLGDVVLAANAILLQFLQFTSYGLDGFAHAVEVLSAHGKGRKDQTEFRLHVKQSSVMALVCAGLFSLVYFIFGDDLISLFSDIEAVTDMAETYVIWMVLIPVVAIWGYQFDGIYFGLTQTRILRNMMIVSFGLYVPISLSLLEFWGNHGLWAAFTFFMLLRAITLGLMFPRVEKKAFS